MADEKKKKDSKKWDNERRNEKKFEMQEKKKLSLIWKRMEEIKYFKKRGIR